MHPWVERVREYEPEGIGGSTAPIFKDNPKATQTQSLMPGLGDEFRVAREARHLSLSDVSEQIHIRSVYLQSIENEEWSVIAAPVYVRGFVRTYARFLGLDPEHAVALFNDSIGELAARPHEPVALGPIDEPRRPSPLLFLAGALALLLVGFVGFRYFEYQQNGADTNAVSQVTSVPSVAPSAPAQKMAAEPTPKPAPPHAAKTLEVSVTAPSWLLVRVDGAQVLEGIMPAGTRKSFHGKHVFVRAGNAGGVSLSLNGKNLGPMGHSGDVTQRTLTLAAATAE
jgi:transcriptional regulator with XRE-family HTH domain